MKGGLVWSQSVERPTQSWKPPPLGSPASGGISDQSELPSIVRGGGLGLTWPMTERNPETHMCGVRPPPIPGSPESRKPPAKWRWRQRLALFRAFWPMPPWPKHRGGHDGPDTQRRAAPGPIAAAVPQDRARGGAHRAGVANPLSAAGLHSLDRDYCPGEYTFFFFKIEEVFF